MSYQNVGVPKFYINIFEWLESNGRLPSPLESATEMQENFSFRTIPNPLQEFQKIKWNKDNTTFPSYAFKQNTASCESFIAILSHTLGVSADGSSQKNIIIRHSDGSHNAVPFTHIVNGGSSENKIEPLYDGWSLSSFEFPSDNEYFVISFSNLSNIGSIVCGTTYKMNNSPEINLTMTRELDGINKKRTFGGYDLVHNSYTKSLNWGDLAAWELKRKGSQDIYDKSLSRIGRRSWDLSFTYMQDENLFPDVSSLSNYEISGWSANNSLTDNTLLYDDSFFSQVVHKTNGGQIPFIFQADSSNNNPQNFAICKFDKNSFSFERISKNLYNVKLKIREVW